MERVSIVPHAGHQLVLMDFTNLDPPRILPIIQEAARLIRAQPEKSLLTVTQVGNASFNGEVIQALKEFAKGNEPHVCRAAIVGLSGLQKVVLSAVTHFTGRSFLLCNSVEEAKKALAAAG